MPFRDGIHPQHIAEVCIGAAVGHNPREGDLLDPK